MMKYLYKLVELFMITLS